MNQNLLIKGKGLAKVNLRELVSNIMKKDIELMSVHRRMVIEELLLWMRLKTRNLSKERVF